MGSWAARTRGKAAASGLSEGADCGKAQARLQLANPMAPHSCTDKLGGQDPDTDGLWDNEAGSATTSRPHGPTFMHRYNGRNSRGAKQTAQPRAPARGNKASNHRLKTPVRVEAAAGETPSLTGEFVGETQRGLECAQAHPLGNQHQRGPVCG